MGKRLCFAASSGGHLEELSRMSGLKEGRECFLITERGEFNDGMFCETVYFVDQINRRQCNFLPAFIKLLYKCIKILRAERAGYVVTTGALMGFTAALAGKLLGAKVIYIESFARIDSASLTGRLIHSFADLFIVQWEEGLKFFPKAVYSGGIF